MEHKKPSQPGKHPSKERIAQIRKALKAAKGQVSEEDAKKRLEKDDDFKKALEHYPLQADFDEKLTDEQKAEKLKQDIISAEVRKKVSKTLYEKDKTLGFPEQQEIIERQMNRYYDHDLGDPKLRGHVEAPHGTKASAKVEKWSEDHKISDYETNTNEITEKTANYMIFKRPRLLADVNSLPKDVESSLRSEGAVYTKEDNLNAVKAQRDLTKKMLKEQNNLTADGKANNPYLAVYLHGKVDTRGHDFEIAAKVEDGKGPINPLVAFWVAERLRTKLSENGLKNPKGATPTVNVVTYKGAYSGSNALTQLRHGDNTFGFKGFGENFQALQLECGAHMRKKYPDQLGEILQEILQDFSYEFKTEKDIAKLEAKYRGDYDKKLQKEKDELFSTEKLGFKEEIPESGIALSKALREALDVEVGDKVLLGDKELKVRMIKAEDLKSGKNMLLHPIWQDMLGDKLELKKVGDKHEEKKSPAGSEPEHGNGNQGEGHSKETKGHGAHQEKQKPTWRNRLKFFFGLVGDRIKSILGIGHSGHTGGSGHSGH